MEQPGSALSRLVWRIAGTVFGVAVLVGLFVIWWLALLVGLAVVAVWAVRRMLSPKASAPASGATIIEGEYSVEREPPQGGSDPSDRIPERLPPGR